MSPACTRRHATARPTIGLLAALALTLWLPSGPASAAQTTPTHGDEQSGLTRSQKAWLLNIGATGGIVAYGIAKWDYGQRRFNFANEGWFGFDTGHGGADKLGHFWTSYMLSHGFAHLYRKWGYDDDTANLYGAGSSLLFQTVMEIGDGFSDFGSSYEDMVMNLVGVGAGYFLGRHPDLARKIDFRIEYTPDIRNSNFDLLTDYDNQRFLVALKADGFDAVTNPWLKYAELHIGYFARGYEGRDPNGPDNRNRTLYVGLGLNVSRLVQRHVNTRVFDYFQLPYTSVRADFGLDK